MNCMPYFSVQDGIAGGGKVADTAGSAEEDAVPGNIAENLSRGKHVE